MKYFFPALMGLVILCGLMLVITPFIAETFFPASDNRYVRGKDQEVKQELANWFNAQEQDFTEAKGIQLRSAQQKIAWFRFKTTRQHVQAFIMQLALQQKALTDSVMKASFLRYQPPADWWQPTQLKRQTYFTRKQKEQAFYLIYDAERQQGYLLMTTQVKPAKF